jgi:TRAP-type C4-dicarboxylate transport system permease small subunit
VVRRSGQNSSPAGGSADPIVTVMRIREINRTIRTAFICATILGGFGMVAWTAVKLVGMSSVWEMAVATIGTALTVGAAPVIVTWKVVAKLRRVTKDVSGRVQDLELSVDGGRTSCGLNEDGTTPKDLE